MRRLKPLSGLCAKYIQPEPAVSRVSKNSMFGSGCTSQIHLPEHLKLTNEHVVSSLFNRDENVLKKKGMEITICCFT